MKNLKEKFNNWKFIIIIVIIAGGALYWTQLRPSWIKRSCYKEALPKVYDDKAYTTSQHLNKWQKGADEVYSLCLKRNWI